MRKLGATIVENTCMAASFHKEGMFGPIKSGYPMSKIGGFE
jgi:hypothetical protein